MVANYNNTNLLVKRTPQRITIYNSITVVYTVLGDRDDRQGRSLVNAWTITNRLLLWQFKDHTRMPKNYESRYVPR